MPPHSPRKPYIQAPRVDQECFHLKMWNSDVVLALNICKTENSNKTVLLISKVLCMRTKFFVSSFELCFETAQGTIEYIVDVVKLSYTVKRINFLQV